MTINALSELYLAIYMRFEADDPGEALFRGLRSLDASQREPGRLDVGRPSSFGASFPLRRGQIAANPSKTCLLKHRNGMEHVFLSSREAKRIGFEMF